MPSLFFFFLSSTKEKGPCGLLSLMRDMKSGSRSLTPKEESIRVTVTSGPSLWAFPITLRTFGLPTSYLKQPRSTTDYLHILWLSLPWKKLRCSPAMEAHTKGTPTRWQVSLILTLDSEPMTSSVTITTCRCQLWWRHHENKPCVSRWILSKRPYGRSTRVEQKETALEEEEYSILFSINPSVICHNRTVCISEIYILPERCWNSPRHLHQSPPRGYHPQHICDLFQLAIDLSLYISRVNFLNEKDYFLPVSTPTGPSPKMRMRESFNCCTLPAPP